MVSNRHIIDFISGQEVKATPEETQAVQVFARQLVEDYNYPKKCIQTRPQFRVKARPSDVKKEYPVDIAVFLDEKKHEDSIYIIVECKSKARRDGKTQLQDYLRFSKAYLGVWFNGEQRFFLRKVETKDGIKFEEIPNIPKHKQRIEDIGKFKRKNLKPTHNLKATFTAIRNYLVANTVGATRDEVLAQQLINLIFCKIYDEKFTKQNDVVSFRSGIDEDIEKVVERITELFNKVKNNYKEVIEPQDEITLDAKSISYVVGELQNYCLMEADRDVVADAFEIFIGKALKGGQGQFFTPRNVVKMMVDILDPDDTELIIDPACGSGGFLIEALKYVWNKVEKKGKSYKWSHSEINRHKQKLANDNFRGIDKDYFLTKIAKAYMTLIGDGTSGLICNDSLETTSNWGEVARQKVQLGKFDVLLTNPPFGTKISVEGKDKLKQFEFGYKWGYNRTTNKWFKTGNLKKREEPQILFIERCFSLLKEGGRMAMVLPSGILGNEKEAYLRQYIIEKGSLFAIIELPFETFSPHVTINTSVLFIQKGKTNVKDIFISINKHCGHDKKGRAIEKDDLPYVATFYKNKKSDKNNFFIKPSLLEDNFIPKRYLTKYIDNLQKINKSQHEIVKFEKIIVSIHNGANIDSASDYVEKGEGIPYILVKSITKEGINFENLKYIKRSLGNNKDVIKNIVSEDNIVITRAGNAGIASNIPPDLVGGVASGFLINIRVKEDVNPYYIVSFLNSNYGQMQLERISSGSILKSIRSSDLKKIKIILPDKKTQKLIGDKLKSAVYASSSIRRHIIDIDSDIYKLC